MDFSELKSAATKLFQKQGDSVLGIDIGTSSIKVVQIRKKEGAAQLETYGDIALGPYAGLDIGRATNLDSDKLAEALKDLLREANVTTKQCGVSIPFAASLVKLIEMPPLGAQKLTEMIPLEARKYIPVPIGEVQLDWFIVPEAESRLFEDANANPEDGKKPEKTLVLVVAIHNEVLRKYSDTLKAAGLDPSFYEIEVFSSIRSTVERGLAPVALIDIGAATSKVYVVELGIVLASHVIQKGSQDITLSLSNSSQMSVAKAEELKRDLGLLGSEEHSAGSSVAHAATLTMEHVLIEARRVMLNYQKKHNKVISKAIITGGGATAKGMGEFASKVLEMETEMADPFSRVQTPAFIEDVLKEAGPDFAVSMGLAMRRLQELG